MENSNLLEYEKKVYLISVYPQIYPNKQTLDNLLKLCKSVSIVWKRGYQVIFNNIEGTFYPENGDFSWVAKPMIHSMEMMKELLRFCGSFTFDFHTYHPEDLVLPEEIDVLENVIIDYDILVDSLKEEGVIEVKTSNSFFKNNERCFRINDPPEHLEHYRWVDIDFIGTVLGNDLLQYLKCLHREIKHGVS